jgi:hypothetical protein
MTTSEETTEQRSAEYLINNSIAYSDMTETEIASVVALKASWKARDLAHEQAAQERSAALQEVVATAKAAAEESKAILDKLVSNAMDSYTASVEEVNNEQEKQATEA